MFITWDEKTTTNKGALTRRGTVQTRGASEAVYHVTATVRDGKAFATVNIKRGTERVATNQLVPAAKVNGHVLTMIRKIEAGERVDAEPETPAAAPVD